MNAANLNGDRARVRTSYETRTRPGLAPGSRTASARRSPTFRTRQLYSSAGPAALSRFAHQSERTPARRQSGSRANRPAAAMLARWHGRSLRERISGVCRRRRRFQTEQRVRHPVHRDRAWGGRLCLGRRRGCGGGGPAVEVAGWVVIVKALTIRSDATQRFGLLVSENAPDKNRTCARGFRNRCSIQIGPVVESGLDPLADTWRRFEPSLLGDKSGGLF